MYASNERFTLYHGDNREVLKELPENSIDSIVTDPPYELGFMGKSWDASGVAFDPATWREALRVLKPGGHLIAFSGSRTYHRMAVAIEDAGFEIRDQIMWIYGSGFPKSLDISKAIDKAAGAEREVVGNQQNFGSSKAQDGKIAFGDYAGQWNVTAPATTDAKQWQGWGTALKPAHEPIVVARKPLIGTVAANVLTYGTGGLNIEASRVPSDDGFEKAWDKPISTNISAEGGKYISDGAKHTVDLGDYKPSGRWPANVIHDGSDEVVALFPDTRARGNKGESIGGGGMFGHSLTTNDFGAGDSGSAARFFYCAKASKRDRNEGCESLSDKEWRDEGAAIPERTKRPFLPSKNHHPTVKPTDLMRYLCRLITPPNGTVLDPFMGSGSTGKAAMYEGFKFIGVEMTDEYLPIAKARIEFAVSDNEGFLL